MEIYELIILIAMIAACLVLAWLINKEYQKCKLPNGCEPYIRMYSKMNHEVSTMLKLKAVDAIRYFNKANKPIKFNVYVENKPVFKTENEPKYLAGWMLEDFLAHIERGEHPSKFDWRERILAEKAEKRFDF